MKKRTVFLCSLLLLMSLAAASAWTADDDVAKHPVCRLCGMDRAKFSHSRVLIEHEDGATTGLCSIHCAAVEMALNLDNPPKRVLVADFTTKKLIEADQAAWVMGGSQKGVMTRNAKWAFEKRSTAEAFIKDNGGSAATFDEVIKAAYNDMYEDTKMIREKRKLMKQQGGAKQQ